MRRRCHHTCSTTPGSGTARSSTRCTSLTGWSIDLRKIAAGWFRSPGPAARDRRRAASSDGPWLPFGADALGRDIFARVILGARLSLGVALVGAMGALLLGSAVGATAGFTGGRVDELLMGAASLVLVLPAIYVVMVLRGAMPLVLTTSEVFWTLAGVMALAGWPYPARGVRAIVARERGREYAEAARALGAGPRADPATSPSARDRGTSRRPADAAVARLHSRRGDAVVRRFRVCGTHAKLGSYAPGRSPGRGSWPTRRGFSRPPPRSCFRC